MGPEASSDVPRQRPRQCHIQRADCGARAERLYSSRRGQGQWCALGLPQAAQYRARAMQLKAEARGTADGDWAAELRSFAASYIRLAEDAERLERALS
jgi:hypothetical protein